MNIYDHADFDQHETVAFHYDKASGLKAIIAVHDTTLGPSMGGCRMYPYPDESAALTDVLRLSRGMTYKSALAGLPLGGGKSVIIGDAGTIKSRQLLLAMGEFIDSQNGTYIGAEDSGMNVADMSVMAERTSHVSGLSGDGKHGGDPSPTTAWGVFRGIQEAVDFRFGQDLKGLKIAIQGVGNVGYHLARNLHAAGAIIFAADINQKNLDRVINEFSAAPLELHDVFAADVDVLAPCAMGGALNDETIKVLKAEIIAGAANNQLANKEIGSMLAKKDILYAPDYVINAGGIIDCYYQTTADSTTSTVREHCEKIAVNLRQIFMQAKEDQCATSTIADEMARKLLIR